MRALRRRRRHERTTTRRRHHHHHRSGRSAVHYCTVSTVADNTVGVRVCACVRLCVREVRPTSVLRISHYSTCHARVEHTHTHTNTHEPARTRARRTYTAKWKALVSERAHLILWHRWHATCTFRKPRNGRWGVCVCVCVLYCLCVPATRMRVCVCV